MYNNSISPFTHLVTSYMNIWITGLTLAAILVHHYFFFVSWVFRTKLKAFMAIFGKASLVYLNQTEVIFRKGNDWDVFLNYFYAVLFIFCLLIGILLSPFIIAYHAQQKRTFAKFLFLLVSSMDLFKSFYFPLVLVPKLLSPLDEEDYYYIREYSSIPKMAYFNSVVASLFWIETDILVVLSVSRYFSISRPLEVAPKRNAVLLFLIILSALHWFTSSIPTFVKEHVYIRVLDQVFSVDSGSVTSITIWFVKGTVRCLILMTGVTSTTLTIVELKKSDTVASEFSDANVRRGVISLVTISVFNVFVLVFVIIQNVVLFFMAKSNWQIYSTGIDFLTFLMAYGISLVQSTFNSISFFAISLSFKTFLRESIRNQETRLKVRRSKN